ncbi:MAG: TonB-dependent receptor, partial [Bacteroidota bacterium]
MEVEIKSFEEAPLTDFITSIEESTDFSFAYPNKLVRDKQVTFDGGHWNMKLLLQDLSQQAQVSIKRVNESIVLAPMERKAALPQVDDKFFLPIRGKITGEDGEALPGATIQVKGTTIGTITDIDGSYGLEAADDAVLIVSFVGFITQEINVNGRSVIDVSLAPDVASLDEVIVVGYGTVRKSDLTGSVGSVSGADLNTDSQTSVDQILQGRVAGVRITQSNAEPGGGFSVRIRGTNSITAGNEPLYVIDGLPGANPLNSMNPSDILSVEVLKDASATAIYGARGSNGVVLITTRQGKKGSPLSVNYNGSVGIQQATKTLDLMNAQEYMSFYNDVYADRGLDAPFDQNDFNTIGEGTDWQDEVLQNAMVQDHRLSFSGGSDDTQYYLSLNYFDQEGIIINSAFERFSGRLNLTHAINDKLEVGVNFTNSIENKESVRNNNGVNVGAGVIGAALQLPPTDPVFDEDGSFAFSLQDLSNPVAQAETMDDIDRRTRLFGNAYVNYNILDNLTARVNLGYNRNNVSGNIFLNTETQLGQIQDGEAIRSFRDDSDYLFEFTLQYDQDIGNDHSFSLLGGYGYQQFMWERFEAGSRNFSSTAFRANNLGAGEAAQNMVESERQENTIVSGFARLNYNFKDRYLLTGTFRADGSSRFGEENKVALFPSGAVAWRLSNESFFPETAVIEDLKLRASFGISGNQEIGNGRSQVLLGRGPVAVADGIELESIAPTQLANPDLKWETTQSFNIGVDVALFQGRISASVEYFDNQTSDLLLALPVPTTTGFGTSLQNVGDTRNTGFEFTISSTNLTGDFTWTTDLNMTTLNNEVVSLGELPRILQGGVRFLNDFTILQEGLPMNSYYGFQYAGIFQSEEDIANSPTQANSYVGGRKFADVDGDGEITPDDRTVLGDPFPDLTLGFNNTFTYKGFQLDLFFEGRFGYDLANVTNIDSENPIDDLRNRQRYVLDRWTPENPNTDVPSFIAPTRFFDFNSRVIEDASFLRLRSFRLAYGFPQLQVNGISGLTVYFSGQNTFTITDYRGYNPDINVLGESNTIIDYSAYPLARIYSLGVDVTF